MCGSPVRCSKRAAFGSEIAEAAAASGDGPRVRLLAVRNIPKSGRTADDVLAYVHLSVAEIVQAAKTLSASTRRRAPDHVELRVL